MVVVELVRFLVRTAVLTPKPVPREDVQARELDCTLDAVDDSLESHDGRHLHADRRRANGFIVLLQNLHVARVEHRDCLLPRHDLMRSAPGSEEERLRVHSSPSPSL